MGIVMSTVEVVLHVVILKGWERRDEGVMVKGYTQAPSPVTNYAAQIAVEEVLVMIGGSWRNVLFLSQKCFPWVFVPFAGRIQLW